MQASQTGHRLVTHNLLASAALCDPQDWRTWANIGDLSTLIDLFCLCDKVVVMAHRGENAGVGTSGDLDVLKRWNSGVITMLTEERFIDILPREEAKAKEVAAAAHGHLTAFLQRKDVGQYNELLQKVLEPSPEEYGEDVAWDPGAAVYQAKTWLQARANRADILKELRNAQRTTVQWTTFLVRTFLYLGCAQVYDMRFTSDVAREGALKRIASAQKQEEKQVLAQAREQLSDALEDALQRVQMHQLRERMSPFAAKVFHDVSQSGVIKLGWIPEEMRRLRGRLAPLRKRLQQIEDQYLKGSLDSRNQQLAAKKQWS